MSFFGGSSRTNGKRDEDEDEEDEEEEEEIGILSGVGGNRSSSHNHRSVSGFASLSSRNLDNTDHPPESEGRRFRYRALIFEWAHSRSERSLLTARLAVTALATCAWVALAGLWYKRTHDTLEALIERPWAPRSARADASRRLAEGLAAAKVELATALFWHVGASVLEYVQVRCALRQAVETVPVVTRSAVRHAVYAGLAVRAYSTFLYAPRVEYVLRLAGVGAGAWLSDADVAHNPPYASASSSRGGGYYDVLARSASRRARASSAGSGFFNLDTRGAYHHHHRRDDSSSYYPYASSSSTTGGFSYSAGLNNAHHQPMSHAATVEAVRSLLPSLRDLGVLWAIVLFRLFDATAFGKWLKRLKKVDEQLQVDTLEARHSLKRHSAVELPPRSPPSSVRRVLLAVESDVKCLALNAVVACAVVCGLAFYARDRRLQWAHPACIAVFAAVWLVAALVPRVVALDDLCFQLRTYLDDAPPSTIDAYTGLARRLWRYAHLAAPSARRLVTPITAFAVAGAQHAPQ